jgi:hypothetical protein
MKEIQNIRSKEDFIKFVGDLILDLKTNPNTWENKNLDDYLKALQRWTGDMEGYYINNNLPVPENVNWRIFADMLMAARMYE